MTGDDDPPLALTHLDIEGTARMVDVTDKPVTDREATAKASILMADATLEMIRAGGLAKGDVFAVARLAGIMAAKKTHHLIPLCHPLPLSRIAVDLETDSDLGAVHVTATCRVSGRTGVEMEALTAASVAALTLYDMCKAVDREMRITDVRLVYKAGGRSGVYRGA